MISYGKIKYLDEEYLFEANDKTFIDEGSGGTAIGKIFFNGAWQQWTIEGRPMPDVRALNEQDKTKWRHLMRGEIRYFKGPSWAEEG